MALSRPRTPDRRASRREHAQIRVLLQPRHHELVGNGQDHGTQEQPDDPRHDHPADGAEQDHQHRHIHAASQKQRFEECVAHADEQAVHEEDHRGRRALGSERPHDHRADDEERRQLHHRQDHDEQRPDHGAGHSDEKESDRCQCRLDHRDSQDALEDASDGHYGQANEFFTRRPGQAVGELDGECVPLLTGVKKYTGDQNRDEELEYGPGKSGQCAKSPLPERSQLRLQPLDGRLQIARRTVPDFIGSVADQGPFLDAVRRWRNLQGPGFGLLAHVARFFHRRAEELPARDEKYREGGDRDQDRREFVPAA
jgi:hypothetical protein